MSTIGKSAEDLITDLSALMEMVMPVMAMISETGIDTDDRHLNALTLHSTESRDEGSVKYFKIPPEKSQEIGRLRRASEKYRTAVRLMPRTFLVSFVSTFDAFIGTLVLSLFAAKPETLNGSGRQLTYKELVGFHDMEAARLHVAEAEVENLLRKSHSDQIEWLEKTFNTPLRDGSWTKFIELTERRNLFVHCHGKVSPQYISVCKQHKVDVEGIAVGQTLTADRKYLEEAYTCLMEVGVKLSQVLWRKLAPDDIVNAEAAIANTTFDLLVDEQYDLAIRLLEFHKGMKCTSEVIKRVTLINLALAYKFSGNEKKCLSTLDSSDWSACSDEFVTCAAVLRDDFARASFYMRRIGKNGLIQKHQYADWPVFKEYRKSQEFLTAYSEIFGEDSGDYLKHEEASSTNDPPDCMKLEETIENPSLSDESITVAETLKPELMTANSPPCGAT